MPSLSPSAHKPQAFQSKACRHNSLSHPRGIAARAQRCVGGGGGTGNRDNCSRFPTWQHIHGQSWELVETRLGKAGSYPGAAEAALGCLWVLAAGPVFAPHPTPTQSTRSWELWEEAEPQGGLPRAPQHSLPTSTHRTQNVPLIAKRPRTPPLEKPTGSGRAGPGPSSKEDDKQRLRRHQPRRRSRGTRVRGSGGTLRA